MSASLNQEIGILAGKISILMWGGGSIAAILVAIVGGGIAIYYELSQLRTDVALVRRDTASALERLSRLEQAADAARSAQHEVKSSLGRIEGRLALVGGRPPVPRETDIIAALDMKLVRDLFAFTATDVMLPAKSDYAVGANIEGAELKPIPEAIWSKIPILKGLRSTLDGDKNIILVSGSSPRVIGIVPPS
jgi:hypothetical protein